MDELTLGEGENKQVSVALSLKTTYDSLNDDTKQRFRLLGTFIPNEVITNQMLGYLWQITDEEKLKKHCDQLRLLGLIDATDQGYKQHSLLRAYAKALMIDDEATHAFYRYVDCITDIADQLKPNRLPLEQWKTLDPYLPHIHHIGDSLSAMYTEDTPATDPLTEPMYRWALATSDYLLYRPGALFVGESRDLDNTRVQWLDKGLQASRQLDQDENVKGNQALLLNQIGAVWDALGEKDTALDFYQQALSLFRAVGDRGGEATTLNNIGGVWSALGEKDKALDFYNQALPLRRAVGDRGGEATTLNNIGERVGMIRVRKTRH